MKTWEKLDSLVKQDPWRWALYFTSEGWMIEHYPENYIGDREEGCGDWSAEGTVSSIVADAIEWADQ